MSLSQLYLPARIICPLSLRENGSRSSQPDSRAGRRSRACDFEEDAALPEAVDEAGVAGQIVFVIAWDQRDICVFPRGPELIE